MLDARSAARARCPATRTRAITPSALARTPVDATPGVRAQVARASRSASEQHVLAALAQRRHARSTTTETRKNRSSRNVPPRTIAARSRFVAATTRTSTVSASFDADALEAPLLEHAQELRLDRERQLADLVEEERAAVRRLERARLRRDGAGERAALVAEQLALEEVLRDRRAVDDAKRLLRARARLVDERARRTSCRCRSRRGRAPSHRSRRAA